ncbi:MAG: ABC transporter permease subunit [Burkholderiales bacterium]|nr:ABC transporter permease subunit [Burkholderiales bacterium]
MRRSPLLWISAAAVFAFLYIPLIVVVVFSFNDSKLNAGWVGFTFKWYSILVNDKAMMDAALNSLFIAFTASFLATLLGTMAGIAMYRYKTRILPFMTLTPLAMPEILLGVSLLLFFISVLGTESLSLLTVIIAHTTFCIGFVAIIVRARLIGMDESIFEAARDLGATPWQTFRLITFPLIMPAIIAGLLMSFTLSIDDFVITFFTAGVGVPTLPLTIYTMIKIAVTPEVNALSTLMMLLTLGMIIIASKVAPGFLEETEHRGEDQ